MTCSGTFGGDDCEHCKNCPCMRSRIAGMLYDVCMCVPGARPVGTGMHREGVGKRRISCAIDEGARRADLVGIGRSGGFCKAGQSRAGAPAGRGIRNRGAAAGPARLTLHDARLRALRPAGALAPRGIGAIGGRHKIKGQRAHGAHRQGCDSTAEAGGERQAASPACSAAAPAPPRTSRQAAGQARSIQWGWKKRAVPIYNSYKGGAVR